MENTNGKLVAERDQFLAVLNECEQTTAELRLAIVASTPETASLLARRQEQVERLSAILPVEASPGDLERLKVILNGGQEFWLKVLAEKLSATRSLASLQRALQVANQLGPVRAARESEIDCTG